MTDARSLRSGTKRRSYAVERGRDQHRIVALLQRDRFFTAYALAQLEPQAFARSEWWLCETPEGTGLVCHSQAGLGNATVTLGPTEVVAAILSIHPGATQTFATAKTDHLSVLESVHSLPERHIMWRLHVDAERFRPEPGGAVRLRGTQVRELNRLYGSEGGPTSYRAHHLEEGCYYGTMDQGRLVAVAGTHAISPTYRIGVIGNVFTHPQFRGRGYATQSTSAVTAELLKRCDDVVLSVDPTNTPALQAYERLGYRPVGELVEAPAWRHLSGLSSGARRIVAGLRGRKRGVEIVRA